MLASLRDRGQGCLSEFGVGRIVGHRSGSSGCLEDAGARPRNKRAARRRPWGPLVPMMTPGNGSLQHWQRCPTAHRLAAVEKRFETVEDLIRQVETTAAEEPDVLALVVAIIKFFVRSEIDPYLLSGVLIEGIAGTINGRIPEDRKREVAVQAIRLLQERLQAGGAI